MRRELEIYPVIYQMWVLFLYKARFSGFKRSDLKESPDLLEMGVNILFEFHTTFSPSTINRNGQMYCIIILNYRTSVT